MIHKIDLCKETNESSGLLYVNGSLWTFNDSGGQPELYEIDTTNGTIRRTIRISNASNIDWEAITYDEEYIYIGDIGNNKGLRKTLSIYRIHKTDLSSTKTTVTADTIIFSYANQKSPRKIIGKSFYDCESMFCLKDTIYLLNKNWTNQSHSVLYKIPTKPGNYSIESFMSISCDGLICDATLNSDKNLLAVVGYIDFMPFVSIYKIAYLSTLHLDKLSDMQFPKHQGKQTEGISFGKDHELIISCESNRFSTNALFRLYLKK